MSRSKKTPFKPWESVKPTGIEERYVRLGNSQLLNEATLSLSHAAFHLFVYMRLESAGRLEFEMPRAKYTKFLSNGGFQKAIVELEQKGFIEIIQRNGNLRQPNVYKFSSRWKE